MSLREYRKKRDFSRNREPAADQSSRTGKPALSDRSITQIANDRDAEWRDPSDSAPGFRTPMRAKLVRSLASRAGWVLELKFDGYRAIAIKDGAHTRLLSRNEKPLRFPEIANAAAGLPCRSAVLDGEIVTLDADGRPSFQLLQARELGTEAPAPISYYLFDLLELDGADLCQKPLVDRKKLLAELVRKAGEPLRYSPDLPGEFTEVLEQIRARGLEGIVAKRADSRYEPGASDGAWLKLKCVNEQEFVIGGYTHSDNRQFASLLVGYYDHGKLRFAGKAGSGFSDRQQERLFQQLQKIRTKSCPFVDLPTKIKQSVWLRPEFVCEVKFTEWTRDGRLRQPVFLGMRGDRSPTSVIREVPVG